MQQRRVTINDVADAAGVSRQTVSRAINDQAGISPETRSRVLQVAQRLGYRPSSIARGLAQQRTHTVGLVIPNISDPFFSHIARSAGRVARQQGYNVLWSDTDDQLDEELRAIQLLEDHWVDGVLLCSPRLPDSQLLALADRQGPLVLLDRALEHRAVGCVLIEEAIGTREAVRYLVGLGHTNIGLILGLPISPSSREQQRGYALGMMEAALSPAPGWVCFSEPQVDGGEQAARELVSRCPGLTALVVHDDLRALGAMRACRALGKSVPADISVVGHEDIPLAGLVTPSLTTVHIPRCELGCQAMDLLLKMIEHPDLRPHAQRLIPRLVVRDSCAELTG